MYKANACFSVTACKSSDFLVPKHFEESNGVSKRISVGKNFINCNMWASKVKILPSVHSSGPLWLTAAAVHGTQKDRSLQWYRDRKAKGA